MANKLSANAERVLIYEYVMLKGLPENFLGLKDGCTIQMKVFQKISGLSEQEVASAYAEAEDAGMIEKL